MIPTRWANGEWLTFDEMAQMASLRRAGCRDQLPLLGSWRDDKGRWRVRCRLCNTKGRKRRG